MKPLRRSALSLSLVAALAATAAVPASAADWFFSYGLTTVIGGANTPVIASGILTTTDVPVAGAYTITGITGTRTFNNAVTNNITGLLAPGTFQGNDNKLFFPGPNFLSFDGVSFTVDGDSALNGTNSGQVNLFLHGPNGYTENFNSIAFGSFTVTPVPEPATWALMLGGIGVFAWSQRRKRHGAAHAA